MQNRSERLVDTAMNITSKSKSETTESFDARISLQFSACSISSPVRPPVCVQSVDVQRDICVINLQHPSLHLAADYRQT